MEKVIQAFIVAVALIMGFVTFWKYTGGQSDYALMQAREYAKHVPGASGVSCVRWDSDGDGYVSCTIFRDIMRVIQRNGTSSADSYICNLYVGSIKAADLDPVEIECGLLGCRAPKARLAR